MKNNGIYSGRLETDGNGNLLASEGEYQGYPVAFHDGSYVFLAPGEPSHNERYHQQFATLQPTQDVDATAEGYAGTPDNPTEGNEHHWAATEGDPHYDATAKNNTRIRFDSDRQSAEGSGHTEAYSE